MWLHTQLFAKIKEETNLYNKDIYWSDLNQVAKSGIIAKETNWYYVLSFMLKCEALSHLLSPPAKIFYLHLIQALFPNPNL